MSETQTKLTQIFDQQYFSKTDPKSLESREILPTGFIPLPTFLAYGKFGDIFYPESLDKNESDFYIKLAREIFALNHTEFDEESADIFKLLNPHLNPKNQIDVLAKAQNEAQNLGRLQFGGILVGAVTEQLVANAIDATYPGSTVGQFGQGFNSTIGLLEKMDRGSMVIVKSQTINQNQELESFTWAMIQTGDSGKIDDIVVTINKNQIKYFSEQILGQNKDQFVDKLEEQPTQSGTIVTILNSAEFSPEELEAAQEGILVHKFNPNVNIEVGDTQNFSKINVPNVDNQSQVKVELTTKMIQTTDQGRGGNPNGFLIGSDKASRKDLSDKSIQSKIEVYPEQNTNIFFTCNNAVLSQFNYNSNTINPDSLLKGVQLQLMENALGYSESRRSWAAVAKDESRDTVDTSLSIQNTVKDFCDKETDPKIKIKLINTILAWFDSLQDNSETKELLLGLPSSLRSIAEPILQNLKDQGIIICPNETKFDCIDLDSSNSIRVSKHLLLQYYPTQFATEAKNFAKNPDSTRLFLIENMKGEFDQNMEELAAKILDGEEQIKPGLSIAIRLERPKQIWINAQVYAKYQKLLDEYQNETDENKKQQQKIPLYTLKELIEIACNHIESYSTSLKPRDFLLPDPEQKPEEKTNLPELNLDTAGENLLKNLKGYFVTESPNLEKEDKKINSELFSGSWAISVTQNEYWISLTMYNKHNQQIILNLSLDEDLISHIKIYPNSEKEIKVRSTSDDSEIETMIIEIRQILNKFQHFKNDEETIWETLSLKEFHPYVIEYFVNSIFEFEDPGTKFTPSLRESKENNLFKTLLGQLSNLNQSATAESSIPFSFQKSVSENMDRATFGFKSEFQDSKDTYCIILNRKVIIDGTTIDFFGTNETTKLAGLLQQAQELSTDLDFEKNPEACNTILEIIKNLQILDSLNPDEKNRAVQNPDLKASLIQKISELIKNLKILEYQKPIKLERNKESEFNKELFSGSWTVEAIYATESDHINISMFNSFNQHIHLLGDNQIFKLSINPTTTEAIEFEFPFLDENESLALSLSLLRNSRHYDSSIRYGTLYLEKFLPDFIFTFCNFISEIQDPDSVLSSSLRKQKESNLFEAFLDELRNLTPGGVEESPTPFHFQKSINTGENSDSVTLSFAPTPSNNNNSYIVIKKHRIILDGKMTINFYGASKLAQLLQQAQSLSTDLDFKKHPESCNTILEIIKDLQDMHSLSNEEKINIAQTPILKAGIVAKIDELVNSLKKLEYQKPSEKQDGNWEDFVKSTFEPNYPILQKNYSKLLQTYSANQSIVEFNVSQYFLTRNQEKLVELNTFLQLWLEQKIEGKTLPEIVQQFTNKAFDYESNLDSSKISSPIFYLGLPLLNILKHDQNWFKLMESYPDLNWNSILPSVILWQSSIKNALTQENLNNLSLVLGSIKGESISEFMIYHLALFLNDPNIQQETKEKLLFNLNLIIKEYPKTFSTVLRKLFNKASLSNSKSDTEKPLIHLLDQVDKVDIQNRGFAKFILCENLKILPEIESPIQNIEIKIQPKEVGAVTLGTLNAISKQGLGDLGEKAQIREIPKIREESKLGKVANQIDAAILKSESAQVKSIYEALRELWANARDAVGKNKTGPKNIEYNCYVTSNPDGTRYVTHEIIDSGIGMTPEQIIKMFIPNEGTESGDSGIGHFHCGASTAAYLAGPNGNISVTSQKQGGSVYILNLKKRPSDGFLSFENLGIVQEEIFDSQQGTKILVQTPITPDILPGLEFSLSQSILLATSHYAVSTTDLNFLIQGKPPFKAEEMLKPVGLPHANTRNLIGKEELTTEVFRSDKSGILVMVKGVPIKSLDTSNLPTVVASNIKMKINFGVQGENTDDLNTRSREELIYPDRMLKIAVTEHLRFLAKRYLESGQAPIGLGNSWLTDSHSEYDLNPDFATLENLPKNFAQFKNSELLGILLTLPFSYNGQEISLVEYKKQYQQYLKQKSVNSAPEVVKTLQSSALQRLVVVADTESSRTRLQNSEKRTIKTIKQLLMENKNNSEALAFIENSTQIFNLFQPALKENSQLKFYTTEDGKSVAAGFQNYRTTVLFWNDFLKIHQNSLPEYFKEIVDTFTHEIGHSLQDSSPDSHNSDFHNLMNLIASYLAVNF